MLLPLGLFAVLAVGVGLAVYFATKAALAGRYRLDGPGPISRGLRRRNRAVLLGLSLTVGLLLVIESFVAPWHGTLLDLQYAASADPVGVITNASGAGVSWALYLAIMVGALIGLYGGTMAACRSGAGSTSIRAGQIV